MKLALVIISLFLIVNSSFGQKRAYVIYNSKGKQVSYTKMIKTLSKRNVVLFGEIHDNPIAHWLELEVASDLHHIKPLILGAEMIEADNQTELDDYLNGKITYKQLDTLARLWSNHKTDYAPLIDFAKDNNIDFIATNIPRRYANQVFKQGFEVLDSLSSQEKTWIAPLPISFDPELPNYKKILSMFGDHGSLKLVMAQAIKDATMAFFILQNYKPNHFFLHYNGAYHSNNYEGILWYLKNGNKNLKYSTISTVSQKNIYKLSEEYMNLADFIICIDDNMTKTY